MARVGWGLLPWDSTLTRILAQIDQGPLRNAIIVLHRDNLFFSSGLLISHGYLLVVDLLQE